MDLFNIILVMIISTVLLRSGLDVRTWQFWVIIICTGIHGVHNKLQGFKQKRR
jgi:hypothetical protein